MEDKIKELIDKMKPYINMDGGDIEFVKYEDHYVYIRLYGACKDCMYQDDTINDSLLNFFKDEIPEIEGIINVEI